MGSNGKQSQAIEYRRLLVAAMKASGIYLDHPYEQKTKELEAIAREHGINPEQFKRGAESGN
jgi:hypothetical protein